jgi:hypothetical protein
MRNLQYIIFLLLVLVLVVVLVIFLYKRKINEGSNQVVFPFESITKPNLGAQLYSNMNIGGNNYVILIDTGSIPTILQKYTPGKKAAKDSAPNRFMVYGGTKTTPDQCKAWVTDPNPPVEYSECAMVEWWDDYLGNVLPCTVGSVLYGGVPNIAGLTDANPPPPGYVSPQGIVSWKNYDNFSMDFVNKVLIFNDKDSKSYTFFNRIPSIKAIPNIVSNFYIINTNVNGKDYYLILDSGIPGIEVPQELMNSSFSINIEDKFSLNIPGNSIIGQSPSNNIIIVGNPIFTQNNLKILFAKDKIGIKTQKQQKIALSTPRLPLQLLNTGL